MSSEPSNTALTLLKKTPSGINGLDQITAGGLPWGRPTLVCGTAGSGKTLFAMEFLVHGARDFNEPGIFVAFEEKSEELTVNVASLGFDLEKLQAQKLIKLDHIRIERSEIEETGEYNLDGLFIRLGYAIDSIGAKRVVLDTIESLFSGLTNEAILRAELRRLFEWLKEKKVTTIITGEKGEGTLTRQGLEEYVSDCVILLDHRVENKISTRLLRIIKYRGSVHGTNEYPFLIDEDGISVLPVTSLLLNHEASTERIPSGIPALDKMLGGSGFFKFSSILVSGTAGTGKTSIAGSFIDQSCKDGRKSIYFAFEESPQQIIRNMRSINVDLQKHIDSGLLTFSASRPTQSGLEMHLLGITRLVDKFKPEVIVLDPISNLITVGSASEVKSLLTRLIDYLQGANVTVMFTALAYNENKTEQTDEGISSLVDAWLLVRDIESNGERNRGLYVMKSRGMRHSNQVREFVISDEGLRLVDVFLGPEGVLTGSARETQQLVERTSVVLRDHAVSRKDREIERKRLVLESKIATLREEFESLQEELNKSYVEDELKKSVLDENRIQLTRKRDGSE
ncbi:circadian clock protein KaiC [Dyadobacter sp. MSC1_007]|jgi:circadian clock protein KaiC|uniref:circadian clock protein KaiC n=1 Tax=Dyadobacter sp. MSC1_007 TaxID=2909264 RepID=UPI00202F4796|nr:circadian clock protein KaiC [Dyadobacter sp. MSC1_007]